MKRFLAFALFLGLAVTNIIAAPKPNFVIFIADDFSYCDVGAWGSTDVRTPNLDRLATEGMKLHVRAAIQALQR